MRPARLPPFLLVAAAVLFLAALPFLGGTVGGCSSSTCTNGGETFQVFQPASSTSAIPLCTDGTDAGPLGPYGTTRRIQIDGGPGGQVFPGASNLSPAAITQCALVCAGAPGGTIPCCLSQWEPQTVICSPACVP